jgi:anthranilate synthase component 1
METAITIRTAVLRDGVAHVQAGGGIVADSDPAAEYQESVSKAQALLTSIQLADQLNAAFGTRNAEAEAPIVG